MAFADANAQDLPPGLMGQMWLDFGLAGPLVWGAAFGLQMSLLQRWFKGARRTLSSAAVFTVLTFVIALPLNSGSFDFSFSVDIFMILGVIALCVRRRRVSPEAGGEPTQAAVALLT